MPSISSAVLLKVGKILYEAHINVQACMGKILVGVINPRFPVLVVLGGWGPVGRPDRRSVHKENTLNTDNSANNVQTDNNDNKEVKMNPTITLTDEQTARILEILEFGKEHPDTELTTIDAILTRVVDRGIYDVNYRTRRNVKEYQELKAYKSWKKGQK
jgi:hypothetical protein